MSLLTIEVTFHSLGLVLWTGMAFLLPLVILPHVRALEEPARTKALADISRRYLPWFVGGGLVVGLTGWLQTFAVYGDHSPWTLYAKHVVVVLLILFSAYIWFYLTVKLSKPRPDAAGLWTQLNVFAWLQLASAVLVFFFLAWMLTGG